MVLAQMRDLRLAFLESVAFISICGPLTSAKTQDTGESTPLND
jgi:hypothetical protein